ncbi:NACHT, LRR and PYD domains-containing protein 3-like [Xenia sp. Carnegie-2017]|uniref:NACHT, LRR and PYD domains-containing protein 3-like n=1 Tax=Xenia sp. Carnegie-2017 TaxID=2897299 RepID=UPI001F03D9E5|nr:NACHT, LRR and PYD domains-containing protein 3-like [Xenia sp. Carnegie-2017]
MEGLKDGRLIFERDTNSNFENLENSGIFNKICDKKNLYCFLHLTLQEFLAALYIVDDWQNIGKFLDDQAKDPKWHLVIEFAAGLVGNIKKMTGKDISFILKRFKNWISNLISKDGDKVLGFLGVKCLYELQDKDVMRSACTELENFFQKTQIDGVSFTPVDSNALFEFLSECEHIKGLSFNNCKFLDNQSCLPLKNYLSSERAEILINLEFEFCTFGNVFCKHLSKALKSENSKVTELKLFGSSIARKGINVPNILVKL